MCRHSCDITTFVNSTLLVIALILAANIGTTTAVVQYGVDCSFPIHYESHWSCGDLLGNRTQFYHDFMEGCRAYHGKKQAHRCDGTEQDRLEMSLRQPQSMVNYTSTGYKKMRAPKLLYDMLLKHWDTNKHAKTQEVWFLGNTYTNHWESPTYMVGVEDTKLRGSGSTLKQRLWDAVKETIEEWTGMEQKPTSMYGIREYTSNAVLSPHVDRLPLVSSCIVNVAQDVDEPWPLEIYDRQGKGRFLLFDIDAVYCETIVEFCCSIFNLHFAHEWYYFCFCSRQCDNGTR
jgi:prolyl 4-hydroxylase